MKKPADDLSVLGGGAAPSPLRQNRLFYSGPITFAQTNWERNVSVCASFFSVAKPNVNDIQSVPVPGRVPVHFLGLPDPDS